VRFEFLGLVLAKKIGSVDSFLLLAE